MSASRGSLNLELWNNFLNLQGWYIYIFNDSNHTSFSISLFNFYTSEFPPLTFKNLQLCRDQWKIHKFSPLLIPYQSNLKHIRLAKWFCFLNLHTLLHVRAKPNTITWPRPSCSSSTLVVLFWRRTSWWAGVSIGRRTGLVGTANSLLHFIFL